MFTGLNISPVKRACVYEYRVNSRVVGNPEVMARIGSAGITSGLPAIREQSADEQRAEHLIVQDFHSATFQ
jgi:hypothetical protein